MSLTLANTAEDGVVFIDAVKEQSGDRYVRP